MTLFNGMFKLYSAHVGFVRNHPFAFFENIVAFGNQRRNYKCLSRRIEIKSKNPNVPNSKWHQVTRNFASFGNLKKLLNNVLNTAQSQIKAVQGKLSSLKVSDKLPKLQSKIPDKHPTHQKPEVTTTPDVKGKLQEIKSLLPTMKKKLMEIKDKIVTKPPKETAYKLPDIKSKMQKIRNSGLKRLPTETKEPITKSSAEAPKTQQKSLPATGSLTDWKPKLELLKAKLKEIKAKFQANVNKTSPSFSKKVKEATPSTPGKGPITKEADTIRARILTLCKKFGINLPTAFNDTPKEKKK